MTDGTAVTALIRLPHGPPARHGAACRETTFPPRARPSIDRGGADLPDRVVALGADLGVIADVRRVLTVLYCWPSWFLLTIEAAGGPFPFAAGLDPQARELRLSFADPFGRVSQLTAVVVVPESP